MSTETTIFEHLYKDLENNGWEKSCLGLSRRDRRCINQVGCIKDEDDKVW